MMTNNNDLSERELEILKLVATGASNKEIAHQLTISTNTVKVHLRNIFSKIGANSRTEAAMYAVNSSLVQSTGRILEDNQLDADLPATSIPAPRPKLSPWILALFIFILLGLLGTTSYLVWKGVQPTRANQPQLASPQWKENAPMPTPRYGLAVSVYENLLYTIAGETGKDITGKVERYDPVTNTWLTLKAKPTAVSDVSAAVLGGKIYVPGGRLPSGELTNVLEIYDPRLDVWSRGARLPVAISGYALASFEGKLFLFGGWDGSKPLGMTLEYDPENDLWMPVAKMPTPRAFAGAAEAGGKIYVFGGYDGKEALAANEAFLPDRIDDPNHSWEAQAPMPKAGYAMGVASVADTIYIVGGLEKPGLTSSAMYLYQDGTWNTIAGSATEFGSNLGLVNYSTYLYAIGGLLKKSPSNAMLSYKALYTVSVPLIQK